MATQHGLRIGNAERETVAAELREHFAHGRLTIDELDQRLDALFAAKTQQDLVRITADLPHIRPGGAPLPSARTDRPPGGTGRRSAPDWPAHQRSGQGDWSQRDSHGRRCARCAPLITLMAAIASWLIVYDVVLAGLRFPLPGRVGLLVAIFAVVRGLLRRIFRGPRGRR